ncbi:MAG: nuclease-related domain-containing protein [Erysipelotrichaceae bacterium]|nr:nuclease-related domain-containing protein [Erysipelotrichaceae bacterium]
MNILLSLIISVSIIAIIYMLFLVFYQLNNEKPPYQKQDDESYPLFDKGKSAEVDFYNLLVSLGVSKIAMNVVLEDDDREIEIDCVFEFNGSTFVVEIKNYAGSVDGKSLSNQWAHCLGDKKFSFQNPLRQNYAHTKTISAFTGVDHDSLVSVVVFTNRTILLTHISNVLHFHEVKDFIYSYHPVLKGVVDELLPYENRKKFS